MENKSGRVAGERTNVGLTVVEVRIGVDRERLKTVEEHEERVKMGRRRGQMGKE